MTVEGLLSEIGKRKDGKRSAFSVPLFQCNLEILGVRIPEIRGLAKAYSGIEIAGIPLDTVFEYNLVYFLVGLRQKKKLECQVDFVKENGSHLLTWAITDSIVSVFEKKGEQETIQAAGRLIEDDGIYVRRTGYVLLRRLAKVQAKKILPLLKEEKERILRMAQAWLLCDMAVFGPEDVLRFLKGRKELVSLMVSKMRDSYRIPKETTERFRKELS